MSSKTMRVGLLFGGASVEHEVSVISARGVAQALDATRFACIPLGIAGDGRWLDPETSSRILKSDAPRAEPMEPGRSDRIVVDPGGGGLYRVDNGGSVSHVPLDAVFSVVHGWGGEDGRIQGLLDLASPSLKFLSFLSEVGLIMLKEPVLITGDD